MDCLPMQSPLLYGARDFTGRARAGHGLRSDSTGREEGLDPAQRLRDRTTRRLRQPRLRAQTSSPVNWMDHRNASTGSSSWTASASTPWAGRFSRTPNLAQISTVVSGLPARSSSKVGAFPARASLGRPSPMFVPGRSAALGQNSSRGVGQRHAVVRGWLDLSHLEPRSPLSEERLDPRHVLLPNDEDTGSQLPMRERIEEPTLPVPIATLAGDTLLAVDLLDEPISPRLGGAGRES